MKKILISLAVLACVAPTMADVVITAVGNGADLEIYLQTTGTEVVRGLALELAADGDLATSAVTTHDDFNTYIDFAFSNSGYQIGDGHPLAVIGAAGAATIGDADVSLSVGVLDQDGLQGGFSAATATKIATITYTGAGNVCVTADMLRGGVVGDDVTVVDIQAECVAISAGVVTCADLFAGNAHYAAYVAAGADPSSWCWQYQCYGDANNAVDVPALNWRIYTADLGILSANWKKGPATGANPAADFNHANDVPALNWAIYTADLGVLAANWKAGAALVDCPTYVAP